MSLPPPSIRPGARVVIREGKASESGRVLAASQSTGIKVGQIVTPSQARKATAPPQQKLPGGGVGGYVIRDTSGKVTGASENLKEYIGQRVSNATARSITKPTIQKVIQYNFSSGQTLHLTGNENAGWIIKTVRSMKNPTYSDMSAYGEAVTAARAKVANSGSNYFNIGSARTASGIVKNPSGGFTDFEKQQSIGPDVAYYRMVQRGVLPSQHTLTEGFVMQKESWYEMHVKDPLNAGLNRMDKYVYDLPVLTSMPNGRQPGITFLTPRQVTAYKVFSGGAHAVIENPVQVGVSAASGAAFYLAVGGLGKGISMVPSARIASGLTKGLRITEWGVGAGYGVRVASRYIKTPKEERPGYVGSVISTEIIPMLAGAGLTAQGITGFKEGVRSYRIWKFNTRFKNQIITPEYSKDLAVLQRDLSVDIRARPINNVLSVEVFRSGTQSSSGIRASVMKIGEPESFNPMESHRYVITEGSELKMVTVGSRAGMKFQSTARRSLINPTEVGFNTGRRVKIMNDKFTMVSAEDFHTFFEQSGTHIFQGGDYLKSSQVFRGKEAIRIGEVFTGRSRSPIPIFSGKVSITKVYGFTPIDKVESVWGSNARGSRIKKIGNVPWIEGGIKPMLMGKHSEVLNLESGTLGRVFVFDKAVPTVHEIFIGRPSKKSFYPSTGGIVPRINEFKKKSSSSKNDLGISSSHSQILIQIPQTKQKQATKSETKTLLAPLKQTFIRLQTKQELGTRQSQGHTSRLNKMLRTRSYTYTKAMEKLGEILGPKSGSHQKPLVGIHFKNNEKFKLGEESGTKKKALQILEPKSILSPIQKGRQVPREIQIPIQKVSPKIMDITVPQNAPRRWKHRDNVPPPPIIKTIKLALFHVKEGKGIFSNTSLRKSLKSAFSKRYEPSVEAIYTNKHGKKPSTLAIEMGLDMRPL